jgi:fused signal recognition particle receptor
MKFFKRKSAKTNQPENLPAEAHVEAGVTEPAPLAVAAEAVKIEPLVVVPPEQVVAAAEPETVVNPAAAASAAAASAAAASAAAATAAAASSAESGFFSRLKRGLGRTSDGLIAGLGSLFLGAKEIDEDLLEELESRLLMADVGVDATVDIIKSLTQRVSRKELTRPDALEAALKEELLALLKPCQVPLDVTSAKPFVILMVGINGVGKTTTIGKLARRYNAQGHSVMLAAGDTFRAAAVEQLQVWGERNEVPVIAQHTGADSASVIFDAVQAAQARSVDVLLADTAGRLHNKEHLMDELVKVVRVMGKLDSAAPHEVLLVLDAGTGQNALAQASEFQKVVGVTGICLTKLDGTAKGGVIFAIAKKLGLPIRYIGVGETAEDLRPFDAEEFIDALFTGDESGRSSEANKTP